jgi:pyruvate-ferredoxin/flavodoxin oxidoreductase
MFFGLGADGTVGANKNSIKIIGEETDFHAQGYFVYDSKKSGSRTTSHLRFGPNPIHSPYLIQKASFIACHQYEFLFQTDILRYASTGAVFLLNSPFSQDEVWNKLPKKVQAKIIEKKLKFYNIDGYTVAEKTGMGSRVNTIMQTCFFAISGVLPKDEAIAKIKDSIQKTYGKKGDDIVQQNFKAVDETLANLHEIPYERRHLHPRHAAGRARPQSPDFVKDVTPPSWPATATPCPSPRCPSTARSPRPPPAGSAATSPSTSPSGTRSSASSAAPARSCAPTPCIRANEYDKTLLDKAPAGFKHAPVRNKPDTAYTLQVYVEDCTGCGVCVASCPKKNKADPTRKAINLGAKLPIVEQERENIAFFETCPSWTAPSSTSAPVKDAQYTIPLFEFSGACAGCGETPYLKLMSKLFGDRAIIANATGCSSIYGGNLPTTPWAQNREGRGPAWSNSLFEDNAEFGYGFRLTCDQQKRYARSSSKPSRTTISAPNSPTACSNADQKDEPASPPSATASRPQAQARRQRQARGPQPDRRRRLPHPEARSGSSAATAGPTTSATAASTTSSPPAPTSTSSCSTPRCTPTPAARPPSPPPSARSPSSPPAASPPPRRTSPSWP